MSESILITGAGPNGVTGRLFKERLESDYKIYAPSSRELDLTDKDAVNRYFSNNSIDYVIHCAVLYNSAPGSSYNITSDVEGNLAMFFNLARHAHSFKKMFYIGSGAEYDKSRSLENVREESFGERIPTDNYGLTKFVLNQYARTSDNIYNVRLFGTINPYERETKNVISNLVAKSLFNVPMILNRDCLFTFADIDQVIDFVKFGLSNALNYHDYNFGFEKPILLSEIAYTIKELIPGCQSKIGFKTEGLNKPYNCNVERLKKEFDQQGNYSESIAKVIKYLRSRKEEIDIENIDNRWK